jgi:hypothetical protein
MRLRSRATGALALALSALALLAPTAANALLVGIGDQQPYMFHDPRFQALGIRYARISIGWNAMQSRTQRKALGAWLAAAHSDHVHPLIAFEQSWLAGEHKRLPSPAQLARQLRILRARYPWVTDFATWNEANHCGQPTCHRPALVAAYYSRLRRACRSCNILGAELLDQPNMVGWVRTFQRALHRAPAIWGLHNYIGANRLQTASTRALLRASSAQVWFTETGGLVARHNHSSHRFPESARHAAKVTRFVFGPLARVSSRIKRIYLYQWQAGRHRPEPWDSALIARDGIPRPAFYTLVLELRRLGQLPATGAADALLATAERVG